LLIRTQSESVSEMPDGDEMLSLWV